MDLNTVCIDPGLETASGIRMAYDIAMASNRVAHMGGSGGKGGDTARSVGYRWTLEGAEDAVPAEQGPHRQPRRRHPVAHQRRLVRHPRPGRPAVLGQQPEGAGLHRDEPDPPVPRAHRQRDLHPHAPRRSPSGRGLLDAMEESRKQGTAAVTYAGDMVDVAHEETAKAMLEMCRSLGLV